MKFLAFALLSTAAFAQVPCAPVTVAQAELRETQARFEVGEITRLEVLRAEIEVANAQFRCDGDRAAWCAEVLPLRREVVTVTAGQRYVNAEHIRIAQRAVLATQQLCQ
jgi:hypothetical protein